MLHQDRNVEFVKKRNEKESPLDKNAEEETDFVAKRCRSEVCSETFNLRIHFKSAGSIIPGEIIRAIDTSKIFTKK